MVFWGADPEFFSPQPVEKETDVFFYGYGDKFRRDWMAALVGEPSRALPDVDFSLGGHDFLGDTGHGPARRRRAVPRRSRARSRRRGSTSASRAARTRPCSPRRRAGRSSSPRAGAAIVANPYDGIERWFEPGSELLVVRDADEAIAAYRALLDDPAQAEEMGRRARERVLDEHTYRHRARRVLELLDLGVAAHVH